MRILIEPPHSLVGRLLFTNIKPKSFYIKCKAEREIFDLSQLLIPGQPFPMVFFCACPYSEDIRKAMLRKTSHQIRLKDIPKWDLRIENVSFIYDCSVGRTFLGYCIVILGLFTGKTFYPIDFAYPFGKKRHFRSPGEKPEIPSIRGRMSHEAKHQGKVQLAVRMIQRAFFRKYPVPQQIFENYYFMNY